MFQTQKAPTQPLTQTTTHQKKTKISEFILQETDILVVEVTKILLKDQLLEWVDEAYYHTLREGDKLEYDGIYLFELLDHLNKTYGVGDKPTIKANMVTFKQNLDMDKHLDLYYLKQEEC